MTSKGLTRRQALERATKDTHDQRRSSSSYRIEIEAHADLWIKWARLLDTPVPPGASGEDVYLATSLGRQARLVRRSRNGRSGVERYCGAGQSRVNRELLVEANDALDPSLVGGAVASDHEICSVDAEYAWRVVMEALRSQDHVRALRLRLDGEEHEAIATVLSVPPARVRKWFSRDMPLAFERAGHGDVWRRLCQMMNVSERSSSCRVTPGRPRSV